MSGPILDAPEGDEPTAPVLLGRDVDVSIPEAALTEGQGVALALSQALGELVAYARAGDLTVDWAALKIGVEVPVPAAFATSPALRVRVRVHGRRPL